MKSVGSGGIGSGLQRNWSGVTGPLPNSVPLYGTRHRKVNGVVTHRWLYQGQLRPVAELDAAGSVLTRFVYGARAVAPEYMVRAGVTYRLVTDHVGSVRLVVNNTSGAIAQRIDYDAWGRVTADSSPGFQPFGYAGGIGDAATGLIRFGRRDFDPLAGRFISKDPIGFNGSDPNLYAYVLGDPINASDPAGLLSIPFVGRVDFGEAAGQEALEYWAGRIDDKSLSTSARAVAAVGAFFAALWTPCTSDATLLVLATARGAGSYLGRPYWQYYPAGNPAYPSRYLTRGWGWKAPYQTGAEAVEMLNLPYYNPGTAVRQVAVSAFKFVGGPGIEPIGRGWQYYLGGFIP